MLANESKRADAVLQETLASKFTPDSRLGKLSRGTGVLHSFLGCGLLIFARSREHESLGRRPNFFLAEVEGRGAFVIMIFNY